MTKMGGWWDGIDTGLNVAGMIPGIGFLANGASALGNLAQGNWGQAGISALGMIPGVGALTGAAKGVGMAGKLARGAQMAGKAMHAVPGVGTAARWATPALRAAQPYSHAGNTMRNTIGGAQMAGGAYSLAHGAFSPSVPQYQPPPTAMSNWQMPNMPSMDMFKGFFGGMGQGQQQAQAAPQAHSLAPSGSLYGNS